MTLYLHLRSINLNSAEDRTDAIVHRLDTAVLNGNSIRQEFSGKFRTLEDYYNWLKVRQKQNQLFASFVMDGDEIVGQIEMFENDKAPGKGYINLIYVTEPKRGQGYGKAVLELAVQQMAKSGFSVVQLSTIKGNEKTAGFYKACGWTCLGGRPDKPEKLLLWEKQSDA